MIDINYYVFQEIAGPLTAGRKLRFWRYQLFELLQLATSAVRRRRSGDLAEIWGRLSGFVAVAQGGARLGHRAQYADIPRHFRAPDPRCGGPSVPRRFQER